MRKNVLNTLIYSFSGPALKNEPVNQQRNSNLWVTEKHFSTSTTKTMLFTYRNILNTFYPVKGHWSSAFDILWILIAIIFLQKFHFSKYFETNTVLNTGDWKILYGPKMIHQTSLCDSLLPLPTKAISQNSINDKAHMTSDKHWWVTNRSVAIRCWSFLSLSNGFISPFEFRALFLCGCPLKKAICFILFRCAEPWTVVSNRSVC